MKKYLKKFAKMSSDLKIISYCFMLLQHRNFSFFLKSTPLRIMLSFIMFILRILINISLIQPIHTFFILISSYIKSHAPWLLSAFNSIMPDDILKFCVKFWSDLQLDNHDDWFGVCESCAEVSWVDLGEGEGLWFLVELAAVRYRISEKHQSL